jgi:hypothetical protein
MGRLIFLAALLAGGSVQDAPKQRSLSDVFDETVWARFEGWRCVPATRPGGTALPSVMRAADRLDERRDAALDRLSAVEDYKAAATRFDESLGELYITSGPCGPGPRRARHRYESLVRELERRAQRTGGQIGSDRFP